MGIKPSIKLELPKSNFPDTRDETSDLLSFAATLKNKIPNRRAISVPFFSPETPIFLEINDSSVASLKYRSETKKHVDYDSNCYASGVNETEFRIKILEIAFNNHMDAESFFQKLLEHKGLLPNGVALLSNTIEIREYFSGETHETPELEQFRQTLQFLCEDQPSLAKTVKNFAREHFGMIL